MPNHLKILFVTNNYTPYSGGVVSSIQALTKELKIKGHEVFIVTLNFLGKKHIDPEYVFRVPCPIKFLYKKNHMAIPLCSYYYMKKLIKYINPHIIHSHHPFLLGETAARIAQKNTTPIIFTHHSLYEQWTHMVPLPHRFIAPLIKSRVTSYCNKVNGIIAPSRTVKDLLLQQNVITPITVVPSGLQFSFEPSEKFSHQRSCRNALELLSVSRFSYEKNIPLLLKLINKLSNKEKKFRLTLVGYGTLWEDMQELAYNKLKLSHDTVRFIYKPTKAELANIYRNSDVFVFSSQSDTQGLVLAEAMAGGTPVIALDGAGQRDIIDQGKNGFILKNMSEMIKTIEYLAQHKTFLDKLSHNAWRTSHRYQIKSIVKNIVDFYKTCM